MPLLNLLFPRRCVSCGKIGKYFCRNCLGKISYIRWLFCPICLHPSIDGTTHPRCRTSMSLDGLYVLAHYSGPIKQALKMMKYRYVSDLAEELTGLLSPKFPSFLKNINMLSPVPLHPQRQKERGFNQSQLIAEKLGKTFNLAVKNNLLKRIKNTKPQFNLKLPERRANVKNAFQCLKPESVRHKSIVLIDDVTTTLSTIKECGKVLKKAKAKLVWAIVIAHGN